MGDMAIEHVDDEVSVTAMLPPLEKGIHNLWVILPQVDEVRRLMGNHADHARTWSSALIASKMSTPCLAKNASFG